MGRLFLGIGLLLLLLALGIWVAVAMNDLHTPVTDMLETAAQQAMAGDLEQGISLARQAKDHWSYHWRRTASVSDHTPMDEIDGLFAQMDVYAQTGMVTEFAAYCTRLAELIDCISDAHSLTWWNLL